MSHHQSPLNESEAAGDLRSTFAVALKLFVSPIAAELGNVYLLYPEHSFFYKCFNVLSFFSNTTFLVGFDSSHKRIL